MKNETTYNGWKNYETWRINLEWFDDEELIQELASDCKTVLDLSTAMKYYIQSHLDEQPETLFRYYAEAFISEVSFYEIAEHYTDLYFNTEDKK